MGIVEGDEGLIREVGSSATREDNIVQKHTLRSLTRLRQRGDYGQNPPCMRGGLRTAVDRNGLVMMIMKMM